MERITSAELTEWLAYDSIEPMGNIEPTYMAATICSTIVNVLRAMFAKGKPDMLMPSAFVPEWAPLGGENEKDIKDDKPQSTSEMKSKLMALVNATGGKHRKRTPEEMRTIKG